VCSNMGIIFRTSLLENSCCCHFLGTGYNESFNETVSMYCILYITVLFYVSLQPLEIGAVQTVNFRGAPC
jgi:hypothetical protein